MRAWSLLLTQGKEHRYCSMNVLYDTKRIRIQYCTSNLRLGLLSIMAVYLMNNYELLAFLVAMRFDAIVESMGVWKKIIL